MSGQRVILVVLDGCGIGAMPDAEQYKDPPGANTIGNVARACDGIRLPNLASLGLRRLVDIHGTTDVTQPIGQWARVCLKSPGKDTTTGHWEIAGILLDQPFDLFPNGFPPHIINAFLERTGCDGVLANCHASGTVVIQNYHQQHSDSGQPIVYTSADSVFQIAADVDTVPLDRLYEWCRHAREVLNDRANVGRVIARPYQVTDGIPQRLGKQRRDFAVPPPQPTLLNAVEHAGGEVFAVGKIEDIFLGNGVTHARHTSGNQEGMDVTMQAIHGLFHSDSGSQIEVDGSRPQLIFTNLVDTDALYGHRNRPTEFGRALEQIDAFAGAAIDALRDDDLLMLVADHGCDPTVPGTDHTREYVPLLTYSRSADPGDMGTLDSLTRVSDLVTDWLNIDAAGSSASAAKMAV